MDTINNCMAHGLPLSCDARLVAQEQPRCYYDNFSDSAEFQSYLANGCLIIHTDGDWHIHALSEQSDIV